jgi:drug/metabolite transporter (DMT)-like permease
MQERQPTRLALVSIGLWSFGMYLGRLISISSEFILLGIAYCFTFITLLIYHRGQNKGQQVWSLSRLKLNYFLVGPFGYGLYSIGLIQSFRAFNTASETTILNYTWPMFTVLFTAALNRGGQKRAFSTRLIEAVGILMGFLAVIVLSSEGNFTELSFSNPAGILWGLLSGASYGFFSAYSSRVSKEDHSLFLLASVSISILLVGILSIPEIDLLPTFTPTIILIAVILGSLMDGVGYITWTKANRLVEENRATSSIASIAALMYALPVLSLVIITLLLGERSIFQGYFAASLVLVVLSAVICDRAEQIGARLIAGGSKEPSGTN